MAKLDLKQNYRYTDGRLYRAGKGVEVPDGFAEWLSGKGAEEKQEASTSLDGVQFASAAARTAAEEAGLTAADFEGQKGSGADGFTKPDVTALIEARG